MNATTLLYLIILIAYCFGAHLFLSRSSRGIASYLLIGKLYLLVFTVFGFLLWQYLPSEGLFTLYCYGIFVGGVVLLGICAKASWTRYKVLRSFFVILAVILLLMALDAFIIEPHWLSIRHETMYSSKISKPMRICVVADIQTDEIGDFEREVLMRVKQESPDLVLFCGDYIDRFDELRSHQMKLLNRLLKDIDLAPTHGVFVVQGDHDVGADWMKSFDGLSYEVSEHTTTMEAGEATITLLSLADSRDLKNRPATSKKFHIILGHSPDYVMLRPDADLLVAGHTHGGQIQLPFIGPLITYSRVPRQWAGGCMTDTGYGAKLCISRGIGMARWNSPPVRFLCRPELVFIDVVPGQPSSVISITGDRSNPPTNGPPCF
ncbi:MAG: metallophosphoesterase [Candidatus Obscuribacterales bacterium]